MSFQWQFVAAILYVELGITLLLCLRPISSKWWSSLFKSSIAKKVASNGSTVFYMLASILGLFCVDAWREMQKYIDREEQAKAEATVNPDTLNHILMWKFRSQRNLYIRWNLTLIFCCSDAFFQRIFAFLVDCYSTTGVITERQSDSKGGSFSCKISGGICFANGRAAHWSE